MPYPYSTVPVPQDSINFTSIESLFNNFITDVNNITSANAAVAALTFPTPPISIADESAWDTHYAAINSYNASVTSQNTIIATALADLPTTQAAIIALLPANTWVKITHSATIVWIGYHTNNAQSAYTPVLQYHIQTDSPSTPLVDGN